MSKPNEKMVAYWDEQAGPRWVNLQERLDASIAEIGHAAMNLGAAAPGESVLDVGCGCGATALELARRVGPEGRVHGVDVSGPMLARARERLAEAGQDHASFELGDAQVQPFDGSFDLVFSRFGVMFFDDVEAAFANLLSAARPGGRLAFACWREREANPWMWTSMQAAARHLEMPELPDDPHAPGPFGLHDGERLAGLLAAAGWLDVTLADLDLDLRLAGGLPLDETVEFAMAMGPMPDLLKDVGDEVRERVRASVHEALAPHAGPEGVTLPGAARLVSARRSD